MGEIRIVSDGTKEGTTVFIDGVKMTTDHWELLTWQFDFPREASTVRVEHLRLPGRLNLPAMKRFQQEGKAEVVPYGGGSSILIATVEPKEKENGRV